MFAIPPWITFVVAGLVTSFGLYRLYIAWTSDSESLRQRKGLYGMSRRRHAIYGVLYLVLGGLLLASGLGYSPFGRKVKDDNTPAAQPTDPTLPKEGTPERPDEKSVLVE